MPAGHAQNGVSGILTASGGTYNIDIDGIGAAYGGPVYRYRNRTTSVAATLNRRALLRYTDGRFPFSGSVIRDEFAGVDDLDGSTASLTWKVDNHKEYTATVLISNIRLDRMAKGGRGSTGSGNEEVRYTGTLEVVGGITEQAVT